MHRSHHPTCSARAACSLRGPVSQLDATTQTKMCRKILTSSGWCVIFYCCSAQCRVVPRSGAGRSCHERPRQVIILFPIGRFFPICRRSEGRGCLRGQLSRRPLHAVLQAFGPPLHVHSCSELCCCCASVLQKRLKVSSNKSTEQQPERSSRY